MLVWYSCHMAHPSVLESMQVELNGVWALLHILFKHGWLQSWYIWSFSSFDCARTFDARGLEKWGLKLYMAGMLNATQDFNSIATGWLMAIMCTNNECHFPTPENKKRPQFMTLCWQFVDNQLNFLLILCTMWVHLGIGSKVTCSVVLLQCWACHSVITNLKIIPCGWEFCMEHQQLPCNKLRWHRCKC